MTKLKKIKLWNLPNVDILISATSALFLFVVFYFHASILWILISFILLLRLKNIKYVFLIIFLLGLMFISQLVQSQNHLNVFVNDNFKVHAQTNMGPIISVNGSKVLVNDYSLHYSGDIIKVQGLVSKPENSKSFNIIAYLKGMNIYNIINNPKVATISINNSLSNNLHKLVCSGPEYYQKMASLLLFGKKLSISKELYSWSIHLSIVHLFVISGFHISIIYIIFKKILSVFRVQLAYAEFISLIIILFYLYILGFPTSSSRAFCLIFLIFLNKHFFKFSITKPNILGTVMALFLVISPYSLFSFSFILSFLATSTILIINEYKFKSKWQKKGTILIGVYLSTLPIIIHINSFFAPIGILWSIILTPPISLLYVISLFLFPFKDLMNYIYQYFYYFLKFLDGINPLINTIKIRCFQLQFIYIIPLTCFIIFIRWNWFMGMSRIFWKKKLKK